MKVKKVFSSALSQWALVTHAIPAERVRRILPEGVEPETTYSMDGTELAFISVNTYCQGSCTWRRSEHAQFQTYVRYRKRPAVWIFRSFVGSEIRYWLERSLRREVDEAHFHIRSKNGSEKGSYSLSMQSLTSAMSFKLSLSNPGFSEFTRFLTGRLHHLGNSPVNIIFDHLYSLQLTQPFECDLSEAYLGYWHSSGLLHENEIRTHLVGAIADQEIQLNYRGFVPALILPKPILGESLLTSDFSCVLRLGT